MLSRVDQSGMSGVRCNLALARLPCPSVAIPASLCLAFVRLSHAASFFAAAASGLGLSTFGQNMAVRHGPTCWCRSCVIELRRALQHEPAVADGPSVEFDARGFRRLGPYDRPGPRSPASDFGGPAVESEPALSSPNTPTDAVRCESCSALRVANAELRARIEHLTSENARLNIRLEEFMAASRYSGDQTRTEDERVRAVFSAAESEAALLLSDPLVLLRALHYHEQRLDALVSVQTDLETQLRCRP